VTYLKNVGIIGATAPG